MKICYLADINNYHTQKWCDYFISLGHEVVIISFTKGEIEGCKTYCFDFTDVKTSGTIKKVKYLTYINQIKKILKNEKPDILHSHYASSYGLVGELTGYKPHITSLWGSDILLFPQRGFLQKNVIKKVLNGHNTIFSTSKYMINEAGKYLKKSKEIYLTPFGVDLRLFKPDNNINNNEQVVIGINKSLETISGIDILIEAFGQMTKRTKNKNIELRIAGKGSQLSNLKELVRQKGIEEQVTFYGYLSQLEMVDFLQKLNIAIYPSLSESFGVAAVEAQACGIPVIVSDVDGFKESTKPNHTSLLFEKGNVTDLKDKIEFLCDNIETRELMGLSARSFVEENFNINDNFKHVLRLYKEMLKKK